MGRKVVAMEAKLLAVLSSGVPVNVSAICRQLGISRQTFYKYRRRFEAEGPPGLVERSRRPAESSSWVSAELEDRIVRLRKELPVDNGAQTIAYHLERDRRVEQVPSVSTIHRILVRRGMVVPQPEKRPRSSWKRFEWPAPNDAWQIDATAWALADDTKVWILDVLDDHSRVLVAARAAHRCDSRAAWDAFSHGIEEWGAPARVMSDNGFCFTGRFRNRRVDFERQLADMGIAHLCSSPHHPQTCGKLERSHSTTKRWLANQPPAATLEDLQDQLDDWRRYYNHDRPHRALRGDTPAERWHATPAAQPGNPIVARQATLHRVSSAGHIGYARYNVGVSSAYAGQTVLVTAAGNDLAIWAQTGLVRTLTIDPTRRYQPAGTRPGRKPST